jgi:hypothetical protein
LSELVYKHEDFSSIVSKIIPITLESMQEFFSSLCQNREEFKKFRLTIVRDLRNISLGENMKKIIKETGNKDAIFAVGKGHANALANYVNSFRVKVVLCDGYDDYEKKKNTTPTVFHGLFQSKKGKNGKDLDFVDCIIKMRH